MSQHQQHYILCGVALAIYKFQFLTNFIIYVELSPMGKEYVTSKYRGVTSIVAKIHHINPFHYFEPNSSLF